MGLFSLTLVLFLIIDPFGSIATFLKIIEKVEKKRRLYVILREMGIALLTMLIVLFLGDKLMDLLQVSPTTVRIASGVILFLAAIKILFPKMNSLREQMLVGLDLHEDPFVVPIAIPLIAGPSLLATIILYSDLATLDILFVAILLAWFFAMIVLLLSPFLQRVLTNNGLIACEKLMGMILILLALQRFFEGIQCFITSCK